ncbi:EAL domain-containing protein [Granulicella arctica]|uniref:EAL domain-containing protein n=1 Tax=Granulicella arctica TaxID=940613 RepID=UPI0021DFBCD1|nr:EAL domain-containing protein [Granulicella arctica]
MQEMQPSPEDQIVGTIPWARITGQSAMSQRIRFHEWVTTPLGEIETWSQTLLLHVNLMLASTHPATIVWGSEMIFFYNDAAIPSLGRMDPGSLGKPAREIFREAWHFLGPEHEACFLRGETSIRENVLVPLTKGSRIEDGYYTYFLTPIFEGVRVVGIRGVHHETTESVHAIAQLAEVLDTTSDGVVSVNHEWVITYMNARATEILGPASAILGTNIWERFPHQVYPDSPYVSVYERAMMKRSAGSFEAFYPEPLNIWVHIEARPAPGGIVVFIRDLTEQRRTADLLCHKAERERTALAALFEQAPVLLAVLRGPEHIFELVNQSYRDLLGNRELIGRRVVNALPELDGTRWIDLLDEVYQTGETRVADDIRISLSQFEGGPLEEKFFNYVYQARRELDGSVSGVIAIGVDVSLAGEVLESTSDGILMLDRNWCFVYLNPHAKELLSDGKALVGCNVWKEFPAASNLAFWDNYHVTMEQRIPTQFVAYYPAPLDRWYEVHSYPTHQGISVFFRDVTVKRIEEERLRLLEQTVAAAPIGITLAKYDGSNHCPLIYVNPAFEKLTGYSAEEVLGTDCRFLQGSDLQQEGRFELQSAIVDGTPSKALLRNYRKNGETFFNEVYVSQVRGEDGKVSHLIGIQNDVTDQIETREQLARQARYDALTGLANRYALVEQLKSALETAQQCDRQVAVMVLDLDNFKHMNDRFGHIEADRILVQISRRLNSLVERTDTAARLGGDEFAFVLSGWEDQARLEKQMERLLYEIRKPLQLGDQEIMITASAGIALFPQDTSEPEELLQMADLSMYWIKRSGKNSFRFYSPDLRFNQNEPLDVAIGFRRALVNGEFELFYQPRVSAESKKVKGCEALIRWNHPDRGMLLPAQFVRIAEDTGLINEIGQWVLEEALKQNATWRRDGFEPICMSINVSASQIRDPSFPRIVADALAKACLPAESLELELTESLLIDNGALAESSLGALKQLGVRIAIDDFGTGYSGLHYLSRFPIDTIKIDQIFTRDIVKDETAAIICRLVLRLGQELGLTTVAEGVESNEQALLLESWNCCELQGYMFAKPLPVHAAEFAFQRSS